MPIEFTPFLGILAGAVITVVMLAIVIIVVIRCKCSDRQHGEATIKTGINSEAENKEYLPISRQQHPDVIIGNNSRGKHSEACIVIFPSYRYFRRARSSNGPFSERGKRFYN